jgi:hypothetical protein
MYLSPDIVIREKVTRTRASPKARLLKALMRPNQGRSAAYAKPKNYKNNHPFLQNNEFDYELLIPFQRALGTKICLGNFSSWQ